MTLTIISIIAFLLVWRMYAKIKKWDLEHDEIFDNELNKRNK